MKGSGVYLVKLPSGKPHVCSFKVLGLAEDCARRTGGTVIQVKWDAVPPEADKGGKRKGKET
jgi:hypothetical protein